MGDWQPEEPLGHQRIPGWEPTDGIPHWEKPEWSMNHSELPGLSTYQSGLGY